MTVSLFGDLSYLNQTSNKCSTYICQFYAYLKEKLERLRTFGPLSLCCHVVCSEIFPTIMNTVLLEAKHQTLELLIPSG